MIDIATVKVGDSVYYQPVHYPEDKWENGIVKEIPEDPRGMIRVVFYCDDNWGNYQNYTSQLTSVKHLHLGWKH